MNTKGELYMNSTDKEYLKLGKHILENGTDKGDRTGTGTRSIFSYDMRFNLKEGFPLLTTKRVPFRLIASELLWFLKGDTNIKYLLENNNHIWDEWGFKKWIESDEYKGIDMTNFGIRSQQDEEFNKEYQKELEKYQQRVLNDEKFASEYGELGSVYGEQWRSWKGDNGEIYDQIQYIIDEIKRNPDSRRLVVNAWNPAELDNQALPPCHYTFQFYVVDNELSCKFTMRSNDYFLGLPFNIASYALLTYLIAHECNLNVGELIYSGGDIHIYSNHFDQVNKQLSREPKKLPKLIINEELKNIFDCELDDLVIEGYNPHPTIKAPVAV